MTSEPQRLAVHLEDERADDGLLRFAARDGLQVVELTDVVGLGPFLGCGSAISWGTSSLWKTLAVPSLSWLMTETSVGSRPL